MLREEKQWVIETASAIAREAVDALRRELDVKLDECVSEKIEIKKRSAGAQKAPKEE